MRMHYLGLAVMAATAVLTAQANDSAGFVGTGGIQYLKSKDVVMQREDLFVSKNKIEVAYEFTNPSSHDVTETVLFPLPPMISHSDGDFADAQALINSFKIWVNGQAVAPKTHVRALIYPMKNGAYDYEGKLLDVTAGFKRCGVSEAELMNPWTSKHNGQAIQNKLSRCTDPGIKKLWASRTEADGRLLWLSQVVYSWPQTFKAGQVTRVRHQYRPLVGGSTYFDAAKSSSNEFYKAYCIDDDFRREMQRSGKHYPYHEALSYVLKTGANWARPIDTFTLTIERDANELVSLCWDRSLKKVSPTRFQAVKRQFVPKDDLNIIFVPGVAP